MAPELTLPLRGSEAVPVASGQGVRVQGGPVRTRVRGTAPYSAPLLCLLRSPLLRWFATLSGLAEALAFTKGSELQSQALCFVPTDIPPAS